VLPADKADAVRRFRREARAAAGLRHPNVVAVHDSGEADGLLYIVMEYVEGETLAARLGKGALPLAEALKVAGEIASARTGPPWPRNCACAGARAATAQTKTTSRAVAEKLITI